MVGAREKALSKLGERSSPLRSGEGGRSGGTTLGSCAGRQPAWPLVLSVERASVDTYVCVGHGGGSGPIVRLVFPKLAAPTPHPCGASGGAASLIAVAPPSLSVDRT